MSAPASKTGIIRQSCDACGQSHVRCQPREGQACVRCREKGLTCNYSISRRGPPSSSQSSYPASQDKSAVQLSRHIPETGIEQYMPGKDNAQCLPRTSSSSPQDLNLNPSMSLEQFIAWSLPSFTPGDCGDASTTTTDPWEPPGLQGPSTATSTTTESESSPSAGLMNWNFVPPSPKTRPLQALCQSCSDKSDKLSQHASHSYWPLATQSGPGFEPTMSISLEELLSTNRDTLESIRGILECSCSENVLLFEQCSTSVGRVIDWYAGGISLTATVRIGSYVVESREQTTAILLSEMNSLLLPLLDQLRAVYERHKGLHGGRVVGVGDPQCHWARVNAFFRSARQRAQSTG